MSLLCPRAKILEWLFLPTIVEALGTALDQHSFKPRHFTTSALLLVSARVVSGCNQRKPPSRAISTTVDISKDFDPVSHCFDTTWSDGWWHTSATESPCNFFSSIAFLPAMCGQGCQRDLSSPQPSSTNLCRTAPLLTRTWRPTPTTSRSWHLLPASWRLRRVRTNYALPWWGEQMRNNLPFLHRNPTWHCSPRIPTSATSVHLWRSRWPRWIEPLKSWEARWTPLHLRPSRLRLCRACLEGPQRHESPSWVELGVHDINLGGNEQGHRATHPELRHLHLVHPIIFLPSGQTGGDQEQGSEDRDRIQPKGCGVTLQTRDRGSSFEGAPRILFSAVLC